MRSFATKCVAALASAACVLAVAGCAAEEPKVVDNGTTNADHGITSGRYTDAVTSANNPASGTELRTVTFGTYPQSSATSNDAIEWYVLDEQDGRALLISKYVLDARPYNAEKVAVTWEESTLRNWLNGEFAAKAFSSDEAGKIATQTQANYHSPTTLANTGAKSDDFNAGDTNDKVFLLSVAEARSLFDSSALRAAEATPYAVSQGAYTGDGESFDWHTSDGEKGLWWLRSPGYYNGYSAVVMGDGYIHGDGYRVDGETHDGYDNHGQYASELGGNFGVRPCIWVDSSAIA